MNGGPNHSNFRTNKFTALYDAPDTCIYLKDVLNRGLWSEDFTAGSMMVADRRLSPATLSTKTAAGQCDNMANRYPVRRMTYQGILGHATSTYLDKTHKCDKLFIQNGSNKVRTYSVLLTCLLPTMEATLFLSTVTKCSENTRTKRRRRVYERSAVQIRKTKSFTVGAICRPPNQ